MACCTIYIKDKIFVHNSLKLNKIEMIYMTSKNREGKCEYLTELRVCFYLCYLQMVGWLLKEACPDQPISNLLTLLATDHPTHLPGGTLDSYRGVALTTHLPRKGSQVGATEDSCSINNYCPVWHSLVISYQITDRHKGPVILVQNF